MTIVIGKFLLIILISYLIGAIPFGLIVAKRMGKVDITEAGSGNIGSTNVLRTIGTKAGLLVLFLDVFKGFAAVMLSRVIIGDSVIMAGPYPVSWDAGHVVAAMMVMAGHNWSVYIKFNGGKGVAAYFGGWLAMDPISVAFGVILLICVVAITRHMSRGSIVAALGILILQMLLIVFLDTPPIYLLYSLLAAIVIIVQHRRNIQRLRRGTELKIDLGEKSKKLDS
jgi:glycerol-3-phosphate acyltransferase PlsY